MEQILNIGPFGPMTSREGSLPLPTGETLSYTLAGGELEYKKRDPEGNLPDGKGTLLYIREGKVHFVPFLPDLPVVVRMDHPLIIGPKNEITTVVPIPLIPTIALRGDHHRYEKLADFPLPNLSKTWFGEPDSGEPAYSLPFSLGDGDKAQEPDFWTARCPLVISNVSPEQLPFQRLILRVPTYSLFCRGKDFLTDRVTVRFRGVDQVSQVSTDSAGDYPSDYKLFSAPALKKDPIGLRRSFYFIKSLTAL